MSGDEYTCAMCGETFLKGRPDEEAMAETRANFGDVRQEDCDVVCDDCFKLIDPAAHPRQVEETRRRLQT